MGCLSPAEATGWHAEVRALVRSPAKVEAWTDQERTAKDQAGLSMKSRLELVQGKAKDARAVRECLQGSSVLISTLESAQSLPCFAGAVIERKGLGFSSGDPHVCEDVMVTNLSSLPHPAPHIVSVSTTGLGQGMTDVPCLLKPLYQDVLHVPHADKEKAEQVLQQNTEVHEKIVIRPALLTDGNGRGWGESGNASGSSSYCIAQEGKCRGYTISRKDVGEFVATQAVQGSQWINRSVVIFN